MITRSDIDTQTEGAKSMDSDHKSFRNKRYRQRNRSMVRAMPSVIIEGKSYHMKDQIES
jgi:hypothetical protein